MIVSLGRLFPVFKGEQHILASGASWRQAPERSSRTGVRNLRRWQHVKPQNSVYQRYQNRLACDINYFS
ncbi:MAG: hypothetical protein EBZ11_02005 [Alphaproteobacteria bacterium]|nr:hypothetical protein [Alphaproteobacteria bacterium]